MRKIALTAMTLLLAAALAPPTAVADESYVIGRLTGTHRPLPGYFRNNMDLFSRGIDRVEIWGFRLVRAADEETFLIRPNHEGFFYQELPAGRYTLTRKRNDRPSYKEQKYLDILTFEVPDRSLVNLGTLNLVLESEPDESLHTFGGKTVKGKYTYRYHYERQQDSGAFDRTLGWFNGKDPDVVKSLGDRVTRVTADPTAETDSSEVRLRETVFSSND